MNGRLLMYAACLGAMVLGGCLQPTPSWDDSAPAEEIASSPQSTDFVEQQLNAQITSLEASLRNFSNFFLFQDEEMRLPQRQVLSSNQLVLNRHVFIDWSGPVEQLLADLSRLTGYKSQVIGATPVIPPLVTLNHHQIKVLDVIRDAALQIHQKADLVVYPDEQLIELRYR